MPEVAQALRDKRQFILTNWQEAVKRLLPNADALTLEQVRDHIPSILLQLATALESSAPLPAEKLAEMTKEHGATRFHESYNFDEITLEYRLLRQITLSEVEEALGRPLTLREVQAINTGIDICQHQGTSAFVQHLAAKHRTSAEAEAKYLSFLSHDLRNNLGSLMLAVQLVARKTRDLPQFAQFNDDFEAVQRTIRHTLDGMDRLLQAERLRSANIVAKREPVDLAALFSDAVRGQKRAAEQQGLTIVTEVPAGATVVSDRELLSLILQNLIGNAVKFSDKGMISIEAEAPAAGRGWIIRVRDEGCGIAPEHLEQIFDAFERGQTPGAPGVGLGLTIATGAAAILGAKVSVESKVNEGSCFSILLPEADAKQPSANS
jgi:signal transduction histidine kinase